MVGVWLFKMVAGLPFDGAFYGAHSPKVHSGPFHLMTQPGLSTRTPRYGQIASTGKSSGEEFYSKQLDKMAGAARKYGLFLLVLGLFSLVLMKYVSSFIVAGGVIQTSPKGMRSRTVAKGMGGASFMLPELETVEVSPESTEIAAGVIGGIAGGFVLPLFGGLVTGAAFATAAYILSKGHIANSLKDNAEAAPLVPYAEFAEEALQHFGKEAVETYNWCVPKIHAQKYR